MKRPRVFLFGKLPPPFMGPAIATQILLQSGLKEHYELVHIDTKINEDLRDMGQWSMKKAIAGLRIYIRLIKKGFSQKPELVVIPISQSTVGFAKDSVYVLLCRMFCAKILLHLRGSEFQVWMQRSHPITRSYVRCILKLSSGVIVLGNNLRYLFKGYYPEEKIFVAPNGGNYVFPENTVKDKRRIHLLYLGNLQPSKGIEDVLQALALLPEHQREKVVLDVIGGWRKESTKKTCLELITAHKLPVHFHGQEASGEKLIYMKKADIFLFPPREPEGHPWVIVEAMAAGLPIISTDRGAIVESVHHGINGFIVPLANPEALAASIMELIENPEKRQQMGRASRKMYESGFTEERMTAQLRKVFDTVIG